MSDQRSPSTLTREVEWIPLHDRIVKRWPLENVGGAFAVRVVRRSWIFALDVLFYPRRPFRFGLSPMIKLAPGDLLWFTRAQVAQGVGEELPPDEEISLFGVGVEDG